MDPSAPPSPWEMVLAAINRVESRLERLVSMDVHQADLRRIDARLDDLAADLGTDRLRANEAHTKIDGRLETIAVALAAEATARREGIEAEAKERERVIKAERESRRQVVWWGIGTFIAAAGVAIAALSPILGG